MLIPSMTAVDDGLQKNWLLVFKALIYAKQTPQKRKLNFSKKASFISQIFGILEYCQKALFKIYSKMHISTNKYHYWHWFHQEMISFNKFWRKVQICFYTVGKNYQIWRIFTEIAKNWKVAWFEYSDRMNNPSFCSGLRLVPFLMGLLNYFYTNLGENQHLFWVAREGSMNSVWNFPPEVYIELQHQNEVWSLTRA